MVTGVNPAGDAGDVCRGHIPSNILLRGTSVEIPPPILLRTFGYSRRILVVLAQMTAFSDVFYSLFCSKIQNLPQNRPNPTEGAHDKEKTLNLAAQNSIK